MEREERELLLAAYISGEISAGDKHKIENLFEQDPTFKTEAGEMAAMWVSLNKLTKAAKPSDGMSDHFYDMLNQEAVVSRSAKVFALKRPWLQVAAAIFIGLITFTAGRYTASPLKIPVVKYQTVYVKQPVVAPQGVQKKTVIQQLAIVHKHGPLKSAEAKNNSRLAQQLRSVYPSERIGAVVNITGKGNMDAGDLKILEVALKEDPNANVRLSIIDALRPLANRLNVQAILSNSLNVQDDQIVQSAIVDLLIDNKSKQAIPQMIALLDDKKTDQATQNKIRMGIERFLN